MYAGNCNIKCRRPGFDTKWQFVAPKGALTGRRVHASIYANEIEARRFIEDNRSLNPGWDFRIVDLIGRVIAKGV
jgi:hypothetical protein